MKLIKALLLLTLLLTACAGTVWVQAADFLLAEHMPAHLEPAAYLVSEKYDGVRAIWDGKQLNTRGQQTIQAPAWFVSQLPKVALDGELWLGRGRFDELASLLRTSNPQDPRWHELRYMLFELPGANGSFADRVVALTAIVDGANFAQLQVVPQRRLQSRDELQRWLHEVVAAGGEGLMLHLASAPYQTGRSDVLLKLKQLDDAEAKVLAHLPGKGRLAGMMGSILVELANGTRFKIGTGFSDAQRKNPPAIGSFITFRYRGWTKHGKPRFASFWRVRRDF